MCPFCIGTGLWIAAGLVSATGVSALAVAKLKSKKEEQGGSHVEHSNQ